MSLLYVHNRPFAAREANVGAVRAMCAALAAGGLDVRLTAYGEAGPFPRDLPYRVTLVRERRGPLSYPALVAAALRTGRGPVYTRTPQVALYAMLAGRRAILEMHTPVGALRRGEGLRRALDRLAPRLAGLVAISPALDEALRQELPGFRGARLVAPSGAADLKPASTAAPPDHDFGYVGGLTPGKGADLVLEMARHMPGARFLLAADASRSPEFGSAARALGNLTLCSPIGEAELAAAFARFRIGLAPYGSSVQGAGGSGIDLAPWMSPLKLAEYASAGCAILASDLPAVRAMLHDGERALAPPGDLAGWLSAADRLRRQPTAAAALGRAARVAYEARLSWAVRAERVIAALGLRPPQAPAWGLARGPAARS